MEEEGIASSELYNGLPSLGVHRKWDQLFAYVEIASEAHWNAVADTAICKQWWTYMKEIMPSNPDNSPVSHELVEVFHLA